MRSSLRCGLKRKHAGPRWRHACASPRSCSPQVHCLSPTNHNAACCTPLSNHSGTAISEPHNPRLSLHRRHRQSWKRTRVSQEQQGVLLHFLEKCTLHGVLDIYLAGDNLFLKLFWFVAFIGALAASTYGCCAIILAYVSSPVAVSYLVRELNNPLLPEVVICPFNRFNASYLQQHGVDDNLTAYIELAFGFSGKIYTFQHQYKMPPAAGNESQSGQLDALLARLNTNFTNFVSEASLSCESLIKYCVTNTGTHNCCETAKGVMTSVGKCYRLKGHPQMAAGFGFGLTVFITLPMENYRPAINNLHNKGIAVKLVEANRGLDYDLTFLPAGVHALMPVKATKYEFINDPPRYECLPNSVNYSRVQCFAECIFEAGHDTCNCSHVASLDAKLPACTTKEFYTCLIPTTHDTFTKVPTLVRDCQQKCKPLCTYWQYSTAVSYATIPSPTIKTFFHSVEEYEDMHNTIILDVFFEQLEYKLIKHFPTKTADTFIANLGGQLGLWVGGSILTLLQVIVCGVQLLYNKLRSRLRPTPSTASALLRSGGYSLPPIRKDYLQAPSNLAPSPPLSPYFYHSAGSSGCYANDTPLSPHVSNATGGGGGSTGSNSPAGARSRAPAGRCPNNDIAELPTVASSCTSQGLLCTL